MPLLFILALVLQAEVELFAKELVLAVLMLAEELIVFDMDVPDPDEVEEADEEEDLSLIHI